MALAAKRKCKTCACGRVIFTRPAGQSRKSTCFQDMSWGMLSKKNSKRSRRSRTKSQELSFTHSVKKKKKKKHENMSTLLNIREMQIKLQ